MKDKTHSMNMDSGGDGAVNGYERVSTKDLASWRDRKNRQLRWANLEDNVAMENFENTANDDEDMDFGFLPRNNYEDRF